MNGMRKRWVMAPMTLAAGIGLGMAIRELAGPSLLVAAPVHRYRVLQDRELYAEAGAARKEELEQKLEKLGAEGWELLNPSAAYFGDKGFVVVTGDFPADAMYPDRRAVLLLRGAGAGPPRD